jgi:hypothetical protein
LAFALGLLQALCHRVYQSRKLLDRIDKQGFSENAAFAASNLPVSIPITYRESNTFCSVLVQIIHTHSCGSLWVTAHRQKNN